MSISTRTRIVAVWNIPLFDKRKPDPFPVTNQHFVLDWDVVPVEEREEILRLLKLANPDSKFELNGMNDTLITMSQELSMDQRPFLKFRKHFKKLDDDEFIRAVTPSDGEALRWYDVPTDHEYMEDESGTPITTVEAISHITGDPNPILLGNPSSVLRLGPSTMIRRDQWQARFANQLDLFIDIVETLWRSRWFHAPLNVTYRKLTNENDRGDLLAAAFPRTEDTLAAVILLRQLYSSGDDLFNSACNTYMRFTGDERKRVWVDDVKHRFNSIRTNSDHLSIKGFPLHKVLDAVLYGAQMIHSQPEHGEVENWKALLDLHGIEQVLMTAHTGFKNLFGQAVAAYYIIKQDLKHWIQADGAIGPNRTRFSRLERHE